MSSYLVVEKGLLGSSIKSKMKINKSMLSKEYIKLAIPLVEKLKYSNSSKEHQISYN